MRTIEKKVYDIYELEEKYFQRAYESCQMSEDSFREYCDSNETGFYNNGERYYE